MRCTIQCTLPLLLLLVLYTSTTSAVLEVKVFGGAIAAIQNDEVQYGFDNPDNGLAASPSDANGRSFQFDSWHDTENRTYLVVTSTPDENIIADVSPQFPTSGMTQDLNGLTPSFVVTCNQKDDALLMINIILDSSISLVVYYDVSCYEPPPANCSELNYCNDRGVCDNATISCACDPGYFGVSCTGRYSVGPVVKTEYGMDYTCQGIHKFTVEYPDEVEPRIDDKYIVLTGEMLGMSTLTAIYDFPLFQSVYQDGYLPLHSVALRNVTFYRPYSEVGYILFALDPVAYFNPFGITILPYHDPLCVDAPLPPACSDTCSSQGTCINDTCVCEPGYWGVECEWGCGASKNVTGFGGVISDGSGPHSAGLDSYCTWSVTTTFAAATGLEFAFRNFDANFFTSLQIWANGVKLAEFTNLSPPSTFTTTETDVLITWFTPYGYVSGGFELEWTSTGCPAGSYVYSTDPNEWNPVCEVCPAGSYNPSVDSSTCHDCAPGHYANTTGHSQCFACPAGNYQSNYGAGSCNPCDESTFAFDPGMAECEACLPGYFADTRGHTLCQRCPQGTYQPESASSACDSCPKNTTTLTLAAIEKNECVCAPGYYDPKGRVGVSCQSCPVGGVCEGDRAVAVPADGFWASEDDPYYILECVNPEACPDGQCAANHVGQLCADCERGYFMNSALTCQVCNKANVLATPFLLIGLLACVYLSYKISNSHRDDNMYSTLGMGTSFGLWFNYIQFSSLFGSFGVGWPTPVRSLLNFFAFSNLQLGIFSPACSMPMSYETQLIMRNFAPLFLVAIILLAHVFHPIHRHIVNFIKPIAYKWNPDVADDVMAGVYIAGSTNYQQWMKRFVISHTYGSLLKHEPMSWRRSVNAILMILEVVYIFMVANVFELFDCFRQADGRAVLVADPDIFCYEARWYRLLPGICVFGVLYCLVIPAVVANALWSVHKSSTEYTRVPAELWETYSAILYRFKREYRFWAFVVIVRKIIVSLAISSFSTYPVVQGTAAIMTLFIAFWIQLHWRPYRLNVHNNLEAVLLGLNIMLVLFGLLFYIDDWSTALEAFAVVACITLTLSGTVYTIYVLGWSFFQLLGEIEQDHLARESSHALLFERRHIGYDKSTSALLTNLDIDYQSLYSFMSFAHDDDIMRLAGIASTLERLEFIRMQKSASTLPDGTNSVHDALQQLYAEKMAAGSSDVTPGMSRVGSLLSLHSAGAAPSSPNGSVSGGARSELLSIPVAGTQGRFAQQQSKQIGGRISSSLGIARSPSKGSNASAGVALDVLEAQLQAEARAIMAAGNGSGIEIAVTGTDSARAFDNTNPPGCMQSMSGSNLAVMAKAHGTVSTSGSGSDTGEQFNPSASPATQDFLEFTGPSELSTSSDGELENSRSALMGGKKSPVLDFSKLGQKDREQRKRQKEALERARAKAAAAAAEKEAKAAKAGSHTGRSDSSAGGDRSSRSARSHRSPFGSARGQGDDSSTSDNKTNPNANSGSLPGNSGSQTNPGGMSGSMGGRVYVPPSGAPIPEASELTRISSNSTVGTSGSPRVAGSSPRGLGLALGGSGGIDGSETSSESGGGYMGAPAQLSSPIAPAQSEERFSHLGEPGAIPMSMGRIQNESRTQLSSSVPTFGEGGVAGGSARSAGGVRKPQPIAMPRTDRK